MRLLPSPFAAVLGCTLLISACSGPEVTLPPPAPAPVVQAPAPPPRPYAYPETRTVDQVDNYHGTKVADPYRWLETLDSPETKAWVEAQNALTFGVLGKVPRREAIRQRLEKEWNHPRVSPPVVEGGRLFFRKNDGLQNQAVLYVVDSVGKPPRVLLDPNTLTADGTVALTLWTPSRDGKRLAYGLSASGSDWVEVKVRDVATGKDLDDQLKWVKFSGLSWTPDHKAFYYSRYDEPVAGTEMSGNQFFQKLCLHVLGQPQSADRVVYERKDQKEWGFGGDVTEDGKYLIIPVWLGADRKNGMFFQDLTKGSRVTVELIAEFDAGFDFLGNDGPVFYFRTDRAAPKGRIVAVDTRKPKTADWKEIVPEGADRLEVAMMAGSRFVVHALKNAQSEVRVYGLSGKLERTVALPAPGTAEGFSGRRSQKDLYFSFDSFLYPAIVLRHDMTKGTTDVYAQAETGVNPEDYEARQVFYPSKDGTKVPMFVVHKAGLKLDGTNPTYLYGYGGFDVTMTPFFSPGILVWMEMGGVFAMPALRGGGEYGKAWHEAGMLGQKQNVFDDFIAAAEWLQANGYTRPDKLAIGGGSNGGLLVGAALTQRPELFGAAIPAVGVMDMLRFHKFTIGWAWVPEYGSSDDATAFAWLYKYSPLHAIRPGVKYPATLVTTGDHDDRVVPAHSYKFAATLQNAQAGEAPILLRIDTKAGHGAGKPTSRQIEEVADRWAFLVRQLGMEVTLP
ncbi:MAG: prolyl oligopeptidase family serine peptidase [Myxococcota bacterium]